MKHLNEQGGDAVFSEAHAKELLNVQSNYNKKLQELNNQLAKQKSDLAVKYMKMAQQQQAATAAKAANTPTPTTSTTSTKQTGTVTTAGQPVNAQGNPPAVESINILRVKELNENKGVKLSKKWTDGFKEQADMFEPFEIIDYKVDPGYGYQDVAMFLIKFKYGEYGLCIWDSNRKRFVEEPGTLDDYGFDNPEKLYNKTGFILEELDESLNEDDERYTNPTYMGDKRNWYQKPDAQAGYKDPKNLTKKRYKPWNFDTLGKYADIKGEIDDLKSELRDYNELFSSPAVYDGEVEEFFAEIGDNAAEILNSGAYKNDKEKLKALESIGVYNPKSILRTYYYYYPAFNPELDKERKQAEREIPKIQAKIKKLKAKLDKMDSMHESVNESSYRLDNVSVEDLQATKDYMDAENISYAEDEDGSTIDFDEDDFDEEMRDDLGNMGFEKDDDDILSVEDDEDNDQTQDTEDNDLVDMDEKIDEEKVFYVKINDDGSEFIGKIYKLFDNGEWRAKVVDGDSETFEKLNYDPDWDEVDVIAFLRENYDDADLISEDEFNGHVENPEKPTTESYHKIPTLDEFINNSVNEVEHDAYAVNRKHALIDLYNGIKNDYSIQRYTLGWKDLVNTIEKTYITIPEQDNQFSNNLVINALKYVKYKPLRRLILSFAKELDINIETLRDKYKNKTSYKNLG